MDRLKEALQAIGLKCGGTLEQRADRLFSVKGKKPEEIDQKLKVPQASKRGTTLYFLLVLDIWQKVVISCKTGYGGQGSAVFPKSPSVFFGAAPLACHTWVPVPRYTQPRGHHVLVSTWQRQKFAVMTPQNYKDARPAEDCCLGCRHMDIDSFVTTVKRDTANQ